LTHQVLVTILNLMMHNRNPYRLFVFFSLFFFVLFFGLTSCGDEKSVEKQLKKLNLDYSIDSEGDYRVLVILPGNRKAQVGVSAHTQTLEGNVKVRQLWSVAVRIPGDLPDGLAENLLGDSWSTRNWGAWALAGTTSDGRQVLVYVSRIPGSSSLKVFRSAIMDCAESAHGLHEALLDLEDE